MDPNAAYWITPRGEITALEGPTHIDSVIKYPSKFGLTKTQIERVYARHGDEMGSEGKAREEIIRGLLERGFLRIRKYGNRGYSVTIFRMTKRVKETIWDWAHGILEKGLGGTRERDAYATVNIVPVAGSRLGGQSHAVIRTDLSKILKFEFAEGVEGNMPDERTLVECSIDEWDDLPLVTEDGASIGLEIERRLTT